MGGRKRTEERRDEPCGADHGPGARHGRRPASCGARARELLTPAPSQGRSIARIWNNEAVDVLRLGGASEPVQGRDLFDLATATSQAWHAASGQQDRETAISYAAYRLLV